MLTWLLLGQLLLALVGISFLLFSMPLFLTCFLLENGLYCSYRWQILGAESL